MSSVQQLVEYLSTGEGDARTAAEQLEDLVRLDEIDAAVCDRICATIDAYEYGDRLDAIGACVAGWTILRPNPEVLRIFSSCLKSASLTHELFGPSLDVYPQPYEEALRRTLLGWNERLFDGYASCVSTWVLEGWTWFIQHGAIAWIQSPHRRLWMGVCMMWRMNSENLGARKRIAQALSLHSDPAVRAWGREVEKDLRRNAQELP